MKKSVEFAKGIQGYESAGIIASKKGRNKGRKGGREEGKRKGKTISNLNSADSFKTATMGGCQNRKGRFKENI